MGNRRHTAKQIIAKLREPEILQGKGMPLEEILRRVGIIHGTPRLCVKEPGSKNLEILVPVTWLSYLNPVA